MLRKWFKLILKGKEKRDLVINVRKAFKENPNLWKIQVDIFPNLQGIASFFVAGEGRPHKVALEDIKTIL